jgi:hypothetical protein
VKPPGRNSAQYVSNSLSFSARRKHTVGLSNVALDLRSTGQFVDKHPVGCNKFIRSAQYICTGDVKETIYLRATDARSKGNRLAVSTTSKGKVLWSKRYRRRGIMVFITYKKSAKVGEVLPPVQVFFLS